MPSTVPTTNDEHTDAPPLRVATAGAVSDGKSSLVGRILLETRAIDPAAGRPGDVTERNEKGQLDLTWPTDVLNIERERRHTIDVAYRTFATQNRRFIIADSPGQVRYTPNMLTAASTAHVVMVVVDASAGIVAQARRHALIASLLGVSHVVVAVNKMDLVSWSRDAFESIQQEYRILSHRVDTATPVFIPVSAVEGDNVAKPSRNMPWYDGPTLLEHLEQVPAEQHRNLADFRFPVQYVIRAKHGYRAYAARVASGGVRPGEEIMVLPTRAQTRIVTVEARDEDLNEATAGDSVTLTTADRLDVGRGDMFVRPRNLPQVSTEIDAMLCWLSPEPARSGARYVLRQTTREVSAAISQIVYCVDPDTLDRRNADRLDLNDVGRVRLKTGHPIFFDAYRVNRATGAFILIDPDTHETLAAGVIRDEDD